MAKRSDGINKVDDIDEKELLAILDGRATPSALPRKEEKELTVRQIQKSEEAVPQPEEEEEGERGEKEEKEVAPKRTNKKKKNGEYLDAFMKPRVLKQRQSVYISQDVHEFIAKIVHKLGVRNLTVGVFIDTVMTQHIKEHMDELSAIYYREEGNIFKNIVNNSNDD
jgi:hypothetical protein